MDNHLPMDIYVLDNASDNEKLHQLQTQFIRGLYGLAMGHRAYINPADYENIYDNFSRLYEESGGGRMEPLLNQLKSYEDYYLIEPLVIFLRQTVESGLEQLLQRTGISDVCGWLRKQYKNLRTENFDAFLDFINLEK